MLKRIISLISVLVLVIGIVSVGVVSSSAVDTAQTEVKVSSGDDVEYVLTLGNVPTPVVGCQFALYYDKEYLEVSSAYVGTKDNEVPSSMINPDADGAVLGNWSNLDGVDFKEARPMLTVNFKAKKNGQTHISYFIQYLYDKAIFASKDKIQITQFKFTCSVKVNGEAVIENAAPELNTVESQSTGVFVNSLDGDSSNADPNVPKTVAKPDSLSSNWDMSHDELIEEVEKMDAEANVGNNSNNGSGNGGSNSGSGNGSNSGAGAGSNAGTGSNNNSADKTNESSAPMGTDAQGYYVTATDAQGNVTATSDTAPVKSSGNSFIIWIIVGLLVVAGGGAAFYFSKKKKGETKTDDKGDNKDDVKTDETTK